MKPNFEIVPRIRTGILLFLFLGCLAGHKAYGREVTLVWDADEEVSDYKIYYHPGLSDSPYYTGTEALEDASPIFVPIEVVTDYPVTTGNPCRFTLTGLSPVYNYYFAVTALDEAGNESDYSDEVCLDCLAKCELGLDATDVVRGETLPFTLTLSNTTNQPQSFRAILLVWDGQGAELLTYRVGSLLEFAAGETLQRNLSLPIPQNITTPDRYTLQVIVGTGWSDIWNRDRSVFNVIP